MANNPNTLQSRRLFLSWGYASLVVGFLLLVVLPYTRSTQQTRRDIVRLQQEASARQSRTHQLNDLQRQIQLVDLETRNFDRLVPANQDLGPFINELSRELDKAGMRDITVSTLPPTVLGKSQRLPIAVHGKGTFGQFHNFLTQLENLQRKSSVEKLSIDADSDMSGYVNTDITLFIYNTKSGN